MSVSGLCQLPGLHLNTHISRLKDDPKFNCIVISTVAADGKQRLMTFIDLESVNIWLGLRPDDQISRLKSDPRFTTRDIPTRDTRGRSVERFCLRADKVAGWLYSISPSKVSNEVREKLLAYQDEITKVIDDYCCRGASAS